MVKIPKDSLGVIANYSEYRKYRRAPQDGAIKLARCRFIRATGWLVMAYLEPPTIEEIRATPWVCFVDCQQVGRNQHGIIQAYDYAG